MQPIRYFVINKKTDIMHIHGFCQHTKPWTFPVRLYDCMQELELQTGKPMRLCKDCSKQLKSNKLL